MIKNGEDFFRVKRLKLKEKLFDFLEENKLSKIIINDIKNLLLNKVQLFSIFNYWDKKYFLISFQI